MTPKISTWSGLRVLALLVIPLLLGGLLLLSRQAQAAPDEPAANPHTCTIAQIAVLENRIHVRCTNVLTIFRPAPLPSLSIYYFAAAGDEEHMINTNRYLTILNTAFALGIPVDIGWLSDSESNPEGCLADDCRGISSVGINH